MAKKREERTFASFRISPPMRRMAIIAFLLVLVTFLSIQLFEAKSRNYSAVQHQEKRSETKKPILTIWTILRELEHPAIDREHVSQLSWLEAFHTYNAITSWSLLEGVQIILFGDEKACSFGQSLAPTKSICLPIPCMHQEYNVPTYDCLFSKAAEIATTEFLMYSNSDMLYFSDLLEAIETISSSHEDFLMIGRRTDIMYPKLLNFSDPSWAPSFRSHVLYNGELHGKYGIDYFCYRTRFSRAMPPFLVGRVRWDNWLVAQFIGGKDSIAVDATKVVLAVHLNHMHVGGSHSRTGTDYNIELTKGDRVDPKKIGDLDSADYSLQPSDVPIIKQDEVFMGQCPKCFMKKNVQSLEVMLYKHSVDDNIIVSTVNSGYIDFAVNWLCSLKRSKITNYLFHAADVEMFNRLFEMGLPVIFFESDQDRDYRENTGASAAAHVYGSVSYQGLMNTRTEFIYKIMQKGYNVLLCDVDIIFLRNPFPHFDYSLDIQGGVHKSTKITGGFIFFRATEPAKKIWVKVLTMHREMFEQIQTMPNFNPHSMTEQELVNNLLLAAKPDEIKWGVVKEQIIADGKRFFIDKETQKKGEWPAAIHNNYIVGSDNKRQRFVNISMWLVDENLKCRTFPHYLPPPPQGKPSMVIKVLAFNRPKALLQLLKSLDAAEFFGDTIPLDFYIDFPDEENADNPTILADRRKVILLAEKFQWKQGPKRVIARTTHYGLANQWLNSWFPISDSETCLFLEDDNIVSPHFYGWLKAAILKYYHDPSQFDPRVFGIMMQNQHMIPGNYPHRPQEYLPPNTYFFRYQILSTWGPLFFPYQWSQFLTWYSEKSSDPEFMPLFSNMITNTWFLKRGGGRSVWSAWFMRFTAERGLYAIYTNFEERLSFVVNLRVKGVNYDKDQGPNAPMVEELKPYMINFPNMTDIPLYDFHFNRITEDPSILEERAIYADIYNNEFH